MPQLSADQYVVEIEASTAGLAEILADHDQSLPIPTCPEWTLRRLAAAWRRAHRWAAEITRTRSDVFISVPGGTGRQACQMIAWPSSARGWRPAAARIVDALRETWAADLVLGRSPGQRQPVSGYGGWRNETLVHRADAQLAASAEPEPGIEAEIAADAIDEWLMLLTGGLRQLRRAR